MAAIPVGLGLDQRRPVAGHRPRPGLRHHVVHGNRVLTVDDGVRHAVRGGPVSNGRLRWQRCRVPEGRVLAVLVVLDEKHHLRAPELRHVQSLVEGTDVARPVTEEAHGDAVLTAQAGGHTRTGRYRDARADDGRRADHPQRGVGHEAGSPHAPAGAGIPTHDLGEERLEIHTAGQGVMVAAVGAQQPVVGRQRADGADRGRLLTLAEMHSAGHEALHVDLHDLVLGEADENHLLQPGTQDSMRRHGHTHRLR